MGELLESHLVAKQFKEIEAIFNNTNSLTDILGGILKMSEKIHEVFFSKLNEGVKLQNYPKTMTGEQNYMNLERLVQKYEAQIRDHIRTEHQLNIYLQSLEEEFETFKSQAVEKSYADSLTAEVSKWRGEVDKLLEEKKYLETFVKTNTRNESFQSMTSFAKSRNQSTDYVS